ncbi:ATP-binding cassette sub-family C member Sur [Galleria mellonella]|uniref:ATP-binding cassette sub-family C member Sur n=1 Tax=Galleria mellonella TaxID=7137 RepID=A0A6J1WQW0_GALME|nr:ATP-binding cassette sub-family C member Sur [Galleria mellonella]XP_031768353.2 ATP-binding cassette sub-family C member Sur [Galleria mellonella]XP_052750646.1 ATP-binding cassette sub-family C member Sur [Galleria mellonella]
MDAVCERGDGLCEMRALAASLHSLHLYCASISTALICCCAPTHPRWHGKRWRGQTTRGIASLILGITWCCGAAAACLRPAQTVYLVSAVIAPLAWLAAAALHVVLWSRRSAAPILYLAVYWLLSAISTVAILWKHIKTEVKLNHIDLYIQAVSTILAVFISGVDCICFYDEVTKRHRNQQKPSTSECNIPYKHNDTYFYSKIAFFWLNPLLYRGYLSPLEEDDLGELPEDEKPRIYYDKFKRIFNNLKDKKTDESTPNIWRCYFYTVWPNFYIAGILKLLGDLISVVPAIGLAVIIKFVEESSDTFDQKSHVTIQEFFSNGYIMLTIVTIALISQAFLSQNSTHLLTVEGTRLKTSLQSILYDKCMRLAPWSSPGPEDNEDSPLLHVPKVSTTTPSGLLANLMSQDTYNVMSCVWIIHYLWAIPLKVTVILYLLYIKLGLSAIIGAAVSIIFITPLQFYIGKKLSDNSKDIAKWTDHRISKMTEILNGINVIKLYVWEDLFNEKILNLREVELRLLNKDSIYWSFLTFTTQVSTILVTVITFMAYYFLEDNKTLTANNVFAGLALFNQLTIPLLILPVTVLMVIQAMVSTRRIKDFLDLPESNNVREANDVQTTAKITDILNNAFINSSTDDMFPTENIANKEEVVDEDEFSDDENTKLTQRNEYVVRFKNAVFSWGTKNGTLLEIDDLDIPRGKLIMVVGSTGSGKTSLLSAILGEMYLERGEVNYNERCNTWYAGQPPWLLEGSVRNNIVMNNSWCQRRYARVLRATDLRPDLQLLPEGDATLLGSHGSPLSGGQRVRVCVARAIYSDAHLLALDEPLAALDAGLAQHVVARALVTVARAGRTVIVATNRLELLHYADAVIAMEDGRVCGFGRPSAAGGGPPALWRWAQLAGSARAAAARSGVGPPGGSARERDRLRRALNRVKFQRSHSDDTMIGISEATGAHLLTEVPTCSGGSWRRATTRTRPALSRQLSSPPPSMHNHKWRREVRRAVSADASNVTLQREASLLRRLLRSRPHRTLARWTPRTLRRLLSSETNACNEENLNNDIANETGMDSTYTSLTSNGAKTNTATVSDLVSTKDNDASYSEKVAWCEYGRACGWWGVLYWVAATAAQALALAADYWLARTTAQNSQATFSDEQMWSAVQIYALWCVCGAGMGGLAQAACACAGARARRKLHEQMLHASLHAPLHYHQAMSQGSLLHCFSADIQIIDKKLPIAFSRWAQLALLCGAAMLVNAIVAPWSLLALIPAVIFYFTLQSVYLHNARELQHLEAQSAASVVSLAAETSTGSATVRVGRLQPFMRTAFQQRLNRNQNALLLLNTANRWLGLSLDLVGAGSVCASMCTALAGGRGAAAGALAAAHALLLPAYLAHLARCRADLHLHLAAVQRLAHHTHVPQDHYRDDCPIPPNWQRDGKIEFENVTVQPEPGAPPVLHNINLSIAPGQKTAICGRSGSGKSSLLLTCAGATTIQSGRVTIDGQDVTKVPLRALRHRVVLLPQEPVMFSGTLRENLDPLAVHTDDEIWDSLRAVGLFDFVTAQPAGLECCVGAGAGRRARSGGWSAGRVARAAAGRAALHARRRAALLLDEPPAAPHVPAHSLLTVTHHISSVRGYDRAVVLEDGCIVEQGEVSVLLAQPNSRLARMLSTVNRER